MAEGTMRTTKNSSSSNMDGMATRLSQAIVSLGINQSEFARALGVSPGTISDAVRGQKKPGSELLCAMRTIYGLSIDWLLTGEGTMFGGKGIDHELIHTIRLQVAVARAAVVHAEPTAKALLMLIKDGRLNEAACDPDLRAYLDRLLPSDSDLELTLELYNGHLWTNDPAQQRRNLMASAVAHFEARKPLDKVAALAKASGGHLSTP
jgi:transcriptional regulator with XRE-family HTH domain